jgi:hypothetical protein
LKAGDFEYCYKGINHTKKKTTPAKEFKVVEEEEEAQSGEPNETMEEKDESKDELKKDSDDEDSVEDIDESKDELKTDSDDEDSGEDIDESKDELKKDSDDEDSGEDIDESKDELKKDSDDEDSGEDMNSEDADSEDDPQISGYDIVDDTFITDLLTQVLTQVLNIAEKKKTINDNEHDQFVLPVTNAVIPEGSTILPFNFGDLPRDTVAALMAASAVVANTSPGFDNAIAGEVARERESFDSEIIPPSEYDENDNRFNRFEALSIDDNNVEESDDDNRFEALPSDDNNGEESDDDYSPNTSNYSGGIKKTDKIQFYLVLG